MPNAFEIRADPGATDGEMHNLPKAWRCSGFRWHSIIEVRDLLRRGLTTHIPFQFEASAEAVLASAKTWACW